jgi:hypothetical protein
VLDNVGSFSVGRQIQPGNIPRGNILFQELVEAVFELEAVIIRDILSNNSAISGSSSSGSGSSRSSSSNGISSINVAPRNISRMAAINRRAQFLPHKDSGKCIHRAIIIYVFTDIISIIVVITLIILIIISIILIIIITHSHHSHYHHYSPHFHYHYR